MRATPQINGNPQSDFHEAYMQLNDARRQVDAAFRKLMADVVTGRNYQHIGHNEALYADRQRMQDYNRQIDAMLGAIMSEIIDTLDN